MTDRVLIATATLIQPSAIRSLMNRMSRGPSGKRNELRRRVVRLEDFTEDEIRQIAEFNSPADTTALDSELDGWKP